MSTTVRLVPMTPAFYPAFFEAAVAGYASDNVAGARWPAADADALAREETSSLLVLGLQTPGHHLFELREHEAGEPLGFLWLATLPRGSEDVAYVFQLHVDAAQRRRGLGRAALLAAEQWARERGLAGLALHVFAHNEAARALYAAMGFRVSSLNLVKRFDAPAAG